MFNNIFFFSKIVPYRDNVDKYGRVRQAADNSMERENCMVDTRGFKRTLIIFKFLQAGGR